MPAVNYVIYGCSSSRETPGVITIQELQDRVIDDNLKRKIKNRTLYTCRLFVQTRIFQYIINWPKAFEHLITLFLQCT